MASEPPKVFISYNSADRDWAEWIAGAIESAGYEPIIQAWHFRPGENLVLRMQEAAAKTDFTFAVLSETYLKSEYTQPEWTAAFAKDPTAGLTEAEVRDARNRLVDASLLLMLDRDRQRFQLHALVREELQNLAPPGELQAAHAAVLESLFADWEQRWRECRKCLPEVIPAVQHLWEKSENSRAIWMTDQGFLTGRRIGELEIALRIAQQQESLGLELGDKDGFVQASYAAQALILRDWGRLEEAFELLKKQESLCLELGNIYCNWGLVARERRDPKTEREKLAAVLDIFTELNMPRERDEVRAELEKTTAADRAT